MRSPWRLSPRQGGPICTDAAQVSASLSVVEELGLLRGGLDDAGLAFLRSLSVVGAFERELPNVRQGIADSAGRQEVLACHSEIIGTLCRLVRSHAGPTCDPQNPLVTRILLHLEEDAHPRVGFDVASREGPIGCAEPDVAVQVNKVERIDARSPVEGKAGDAGDHGPPHDVEHCGIVSFHLSPLVALRNPRRCRLSAKSKKTPFPQTTIYW